MLKQVTLTVQLDNELQRIADTHGAGIEVLDCKDFNSKGMTLLLQVEAPKGDTEQILSEVRKLPGVKKVFSTDSSRASSICVVAMDRPQLCTTALESNSICLICPYNSKAGSLTWKILVRDADSVRQIVDDLEERGMAVRVTEISDIYPKDLLTPRQKQVLSTAISAGYFEFPRRTDLTDLAPFLSIKPSTLSEILRNVQRKIVENYAEQQRLPKTGQQRHSPAVADPF